jgi:hypothetical protein
MVKLTVRRKKKTLGTILQACYKEGDKASCMICASNQDKRFADWLVDSLNKDGRDCFMDLQTSPPVRISL